MIFLALLLSVGGAALEVGLEVGWAGQPVAFVVNPLWLTLSNPSSQPFSGEVLILGTAGSPWRGEAERTAVIPVFLAPRGRTTLLLPWPLEPGMTTLWVRVFSEEAEVFARDFSLGFLGGTRLVGGIGPAGVGPGIFISPADFPSDPLLLWPFAELAISGTLAPQAAEVVGAWQVFLGGKTIPDYRGVGSVQPEALRERMQNLQPLPPIWSVLVPGLLLYLVGLGPGLSRLARGRAGFLWATVAVFLCLSLFYSVLRENAIGPNLVRINVFSKSVNRFHLELVGVVSWRTGELTLPGWWHELLPARNWTRLDLRWEYSPAGWTTTFPLTPGVPRVFLRLAPNEGAQAPVSETLDPPTWLSKTLELPWKEAQVRRSPLAPGEAEAFRIDLP
ncbi:MAG: hypothetical protein ACUVQS_02185 [Candidatus Bipolaricaulaceae bacterium]